MDNLYYILYTNLAILLSLITFIVIVTIHIVKKKKPKIINYIMLFICTIGMYLFIPSRFLYLGYVFQSPELLKKAVKYSINPYEKRLSYLYMADIYEYDINHEGIKNGNFAIECLERALKGDYSKYRLETTKLAILYSIKGNYEKTIELNKILNHKHSLSLRNIYIINNEYEKAIQTFEDSDVSTDNFLKADLYRKIGNLKESKVCEITAEKTYKFQLNQYNKKSEQLAYIEKNKKYRTVEAYKDWLKEQAQEYKF